jgi:hypothetical protein
MTSSGLKPATFQETNYMPIVLNLLLYVRLLTAGNQVTPPNGIFLAKFYPINAVAVVKKQSYSYGPYFFLISHFICNLYNNSTINKYFDK